MVYSYVCRHVAGFVSKSEAEKCLQSASKGTFLCRFSDTKLGGVSIVDRRRQNWGNEGDAHFSCGLEI
jgi:hypothetical protein